MTDLIRSKVPVRRHEGVVSPLLHGPGKIDRPDLSYVECYSCKNVRDDAFGGVYCVLCLGRGFDFGWCGCGAALYANLRCSRERRHCALNKTHRRKIYTLSSKHTLRLPPEPT